MINPRKEIKIIDHLFKMISMSQGFTTIGHKVYLICSRMMEKYQKELNCLAKMGMRK